jgi:hypothetical protein
MGLLDQIGRIFLRARGESERSATVTTSAQRSVAGSGALSWASEMRGARARRDRIAVCREMYDTDTRAKQVISTLARDIVRGGFDVEIEGLTGGRPRGGSQEAEALEIATALQERIALNQRLDDWTRYAMRDGDIFLELGVDSDMNITEATRKPTLEMRRNSDTTDRFVDPQRAFWQAAAWATDGEPPSDAVWYAEWQMIHARWEHDEGERYGRPLFSSAEKAFKRLAAGEMDMAVRRKTRAGQKYVHEFPPGTDPQVIEEYKELNRDALDNPTAAVSDFFGTVKISALQGDAHLGEIDDVKHHLRTWFLASPLAMSLLGYGEDLNRDVLDKQEEQYQRALEGLTAWPTMQIVKPLLERQWLLKGIWPDGLKYKIKWRAKAPLTADAVEKAANAGLKLKALGAPPAVVRAVIEQLLPGVDLGELWLADSAWSGATGGQPAPGPATETRARPARIALAAGELGAAVR